MSTPTKEIAPVLWLGVPAVDGARVGDLELFVFGGDGEDLATVALVNDAEPHPVVFECPISEVNARTLEWIRSIAALDPKLVAPRKVRPNQG